MNLPIATTALLLMASVQPLRPTRNGPHASHTGTLVIRWTFGGRATADACDQMRAATIDIDMHDLAHTQTESLTAPCMAFSASAKLPEGSYQVLAVPEDEHGRPVSVPMHDRVAVEGGSSTSVSFNFPFSAVAAQPRAPRP